MHGVLAPLPLFLLVRALILKFLHLHLNSVHIALHLQSIMATCGMQRLFGLHDGMLHIMARGFVSAALAEPAAGIEDARPRLVGAARTVLRPVLESRYVARRIREARRPLLWQHACELLQGDHQL